MFDAISLRRLWISVALVFSLAGNGLSAATLDAKREAVSQETEPYSVPASAEVRFDAHLSQIAGHDPNASCGGAGSAFLASVSPQTVGVNQPFTLSWCDPSFSVNGDYCYGVDTFGIFFRPAGAATWQFVPPDLSPSTLATNIHVNTAGAYEFVVAVDGTACTIAGPKDSDILSNILTVTVTTSTSGCTDALTNGKVCLRSGRYELTGQWQGFSDDQWRPIVWSRQTPEVALGTFQNNASDVTIVAKMVWGCPFTNHYWFWLGGFTDAGWDLTVKDLETGVSKRYTRARQQGVFPTASRDEVTFPCP